MPDINDELLALIGKAPKVAAAPDLPDLDPAIFMSASARAELTAAYGESRGEGLDAFLAESSLPRSPVAGPTDLNSLSDIWGGLEREAGEVEPSFGGGGLEALFMGGCGG